MKGRALETEEGWLGMRSFYEFFAGGGMARAGLGESWTCTFANDADPKKGASYTDNWGNDVLRIADVRTLRSDDLPGRADLAWASFPCQDLSLAGAGAGLKGERSGTFWPFLSLVKALAREDRAPQIIVLENVCGALTSHGGKDFVEISAALSRSGYRFGALVVDAIHFVPQSRPRLFLIAFRTGLNVPENLVANGASKAWCTGALIRAHHCLPSGIKDSWLWWRLPSPPLRNTKLADLLDTEPVGVPWNSKANTLRLLEMMAPLHLQKVNRAKRAGRTVVGTIYKRARPDGNGARAQRAEVRFDDVAGCLRTPAGGSSRQTLIFVNGQSIRTRLLSPREAARLMGLPDDYRLPMKYNDAYHLAGDGLVVPAVRFLAENLLEPLLMGNAQESQRAA